MGCGGPVGGGGRGGVTGTVVGVAGIACEMLLEHAKMQDGLWFLMYLKVTTHLVNCVVPVGFLVK